MRRIWVFCTECLAGWPGRWTAESGAGESHSRFSGISIEKGSASAASNTAAPAKSSLDSWPGTSGSSRLVSPFLSGRSSASPSSSTRSQRCMPLRKSCTSTAASGVSSLGPCTLLDGMGKGGDTMEPPLSTPMAARYSRTRLSLSAAASVDITSTTAGSRLVYSSRAEPWAVEQEPTARNATCKARTTSMPCLNRVAASSSAWAEVCARP
mmetsp:Transcript_10788/g.22281  ORF Transcript_10788/g.22281 Transcript_10788/m.22281 type:complete len:210 (+) Transcript_10788:355-984(+)